MQLGAALPHYGITMELDKQPDGARTFAQRTEALGFDSLWVTDHLIVPLDVPHVYKRNMLEAIGLLNFLTAVTTRVRLGTSIVVLPYRNPITLAKQIATADVLSGGRVIFGAAAGYMEGEFRALNADFDNRGDVADENLRIIKECWTNPEPAITTDHYQLGGASFTPVSAQSPHPPIWIGGNSPRAMRRAVEFGDGWHPIPMPHDAMRDAIAKLNEISERHGRAAPPTISLRHLIWFDQQPEAGQLPGPAGNAEQIADSIRAYADLGVEHFIFGFPELPFDEYLEQLERFAAEVKPLLV